jgi:two-component system phosphate regulon sensor histidine kinase PhoR
MRRKTIFWRLYLSYAVIILLCLALVGGYAGWEMGDYTMGRLRADLEARAQLAAAACAPVPRGGAADLEAKVRGLGQSTGMRITIIAPDGRVLADSEEDPSQMDNHGDRPEVKAALRGEVGSIERHSNTVKIDMLYLGLPVHGAQHAGYIVRVAIPLTDVHARMRSIYGILGVGGLLAALLALGLGYLVVGRITRPLREMERQARRLAEGDLKVKFWSENPDEIGQLADTMNYMAAQLDEKIRSLIQERNERIAILSSMVEGVIAVDVNERLLMANQAARQILNIPDSGAEGRPILEVVRNIKLQTFLHDLLGSDGTKESEVEVLSPAKRALKLTGAPLCDEQGRQIGCVAVMNDISRLRALERMRSEFVANVSHELKTPITAVKGYIETLREGAVADAANAAKFLEIIARHTDRLNAIVDDLLSLSRIESDAGSIHLALLDLRGVVARVLDGYRSKAAQKKIEVLGPQPGEAVAVMGNANLLEQALGNVLDNAIKFSPEGAKVRMALSKTEKGAVLEVADEGIGIPAADLPHIFERFYRVDKGRSRDLGGTGLGLSIVKHILLAHNGEVVAQSVLGKGSTFALRIPFSAPPQK